MQGSSVLTRRAAAIARTHTASMGRPMAAAAAAAAAAAGAGSRLPLPSSMRALSSYSTAGRRPVSSSLLLASSRHILSARPTSSLLHPAGSTRALSLWPFSRSSSQPQPQPQAQAQASEALHSAEAHVQQTASDAKQSLASTAADTQQTLSTTTTVADISSKTSEVAHNVQEGVINSSEAVSQLVSTVASGGTLPHTPTFTELGLGVGGWWPPVGWIQTFLDYMTTTTGLPWWATIIGTTISLRLCLAPLLIYVQGNTIRLANIQPKLQGIMNDLSHAKATGDMALLQANSQKAQMLFRDNDCHPLRSFLLPLVQMPIFVSFFFALRGLANAGLPSLKDGGLGWFTDLTLADPYYVLPVASSALTLLVLETGAETGTNAAVNPQMGQMKNFLRVILVVATYFILEFPTVVLVYWVTNNSFSLLQLLALRTRFLRTRLNLPERITQAAQPTVTLAAGTGGYRAAPVANKDVGFWQGIRQGMDSVKGIDAQRRANAPGALRGKPASSSNTAAGAGAGPEEGAGAVARDRALKALYEQGGLGKTNAGVSASAASSASTLSGGSLGVSPGDLAHGAATEERNARIQNARQRRASRRRI
ncbi:hypothetical protein A4X06_0g8895 [Tilletia controversa]|uniref:Membrane insertase YidC/Oxa/ALB C-terminal domain-containing protein n=1 Tax=Tilletia controversa TaxID=13291 RepID=A0A8X7SSR4_9BASI|nr:hypothetical protein CF328_g8131 [Tilletia controversa]KAE8238287.1 hypothetical protein A4X06_0g8895 [Tilletia controversa]